MPAYLTIAAAAVAAVISTPETEMLRIDAPDDFEIGYQAHNDVLQMIELVEPPDTVEDWSKLITLQLMYNGTQRVGLERFYSNWRQAMHGACANMTDVLTKGTVDGRPAIRGRLSCPKNPQTGKPENLEAVLVEGEVNLMMVQIAFRHSIAPADRALIERIASSLKICDQRTLSICGPRKAVGFVPVK